MKLPPLENALHYQGLYVYDFGEWTALGYTAEEIAVLLESERYAGGKVYRIHRVQPDGSLELRGVSPERFRIESGTFFWRNDREAARSDFETLVSAAQKCAPPCRAALQLAEQVGAQLPQRFVTALIYPAECEEELAAWLNALEYRGGDLAESGPSHVSNYYALDRRLLAQHQLWSSASIPSRSAAEVLATVRNPVQRVLVA